MSLSLILFCCTGSRTSRVCRCLSSYLGNNLAATIDKTNNQRKHFIFLFLCALFSSLLNLVNNFIFNCKILDKL